MVSKKIFIFFHYKSMGANDLWGVASLNPRSLVGRIFVGKHCYILNIIALSLMDTEKQMFEGS